MEHQSQSVDDPGSDADRDDPLRDAERRGIERARKGHEEAFERLLGRCRGLEDEKFEWIAERREHIEAFTAARKAQDDHVHSADDRAADWERQRRALQDRLRASADRVRDLEAIDDRHREAARATARTHQVERDRMIDAHASALAEVETNEETARHALAKAEEDFRIEAYRLSALIVFRSKEAEAAAAETVAVNQRLALLLTSTSWRVTRPLRLMSRLVRRASGVPRRLVRAASSRR